ncbi:MAG TPA: sugar porter family MFS transporter [Verrucomicrobiae bacterium]|jgi:sugar porter (SP) family MFS transporter|nr:sugar porter family MFS transporter [Verrucomicrobiae bacterium]
MNLYLLLVCLVGAAGGFLFGFDTSVISGVIEYISSPSVYNLNEVTKGWTVSCIIIGCMAGCVVAGPLSSRVGRKKTLILTALIFLFSSLGCALTSHYSSFVSYRIVAGIAVGAASMLAPIYIAELSPPAHRGKLVSLNLFAIFLGQSMAFYSNYFLRDVGGVNNWRWMLAVMAVPSFLLFIFLLFVPESPRWLAEKNQMDAALKILTRINGAAEARREFEEIKQTINASKGRLSELLEPGMFRILVIGILLAIFQQVTGINVVMYYAPAIFKSAGFGNESALLQTALMGMVNLTFAVISMFFVDKMGRKPLMIIGSIGMSIAMTLLALTFITGHAKGYFVLICIMGYLAAFGFSLGPVVWVLIAEIFPNRLRSYAVAIATFALWGANFVVSLTFPYLLKSLKGYSFVIYGSMCVLCLLFVLKYLEETKGKTLEEIEMGFTKSVPQKAPSTSPST